MPRNYSSEQGNPEDQARQDVEAIYRDAMSISERTSFSSALQALNERHAQLQPLADHLTRLRSRGFPWWPNMEQELAEARRLADQSLRNAQSEAQRASSQLRSAVDGVAQRAQNFLSRGNLMNQVSAIDALDMERERVQTQVNAAEQRINAMAEPFTKLVDKLKGGVDGSHYTMDQYDAASFRVRAEENPLSVAAATWEDSPQGSVEGSFYLTDLMVRFEQNSNGTRRVLLEKAVGALTASDDSERGWFFKDEVLTLQFRSGEGGPTKCTLVFKGTDSKAMDEFVERVRSGQLDAWKVRRTQGSVQLASSAAMPVKWPNVCLNCAAPIEAPVRGQTEVVCGYCRSRFPVELSK